MTYTLLIQGPLNPTSLDAIQMFDYHKQFDEIVISHWSCDSPELKNKLSSIENIIVVESDLPNIAETTNEGPDNGSTFWWSITSTYEGLKKCTSDYTVKMRSDEYYGDFSKMKTLFEEDEKKMVFANIFVKYWYAWRHHIGDHMFVAKTKRLQETYEWMNKCYTEECPWWMVQKKRSTAETILARSYIHTNYYQTHKNPKTNIPYMSEAHGDWMNGERLLVKLFNVIDINLLGEHYLKWAHGGTEWKNNWNWPIKTMEDMLIRKEADIVPSDQGFYDEAPLTFYDE